MSSQQLVLTTTSLHNVVISNSSDVIYYEIVTPKWERHITRISRFDPNVRDFDVIGELKNEGDKPVAVKIYGGEFKPVEEFLGIDGGTAETVVKGKLRGKDGRTYLWRVSGHHLELVREDHPDDKPVAVFHRHKRYLFVLRMSRHPYIEIESSVLDTLDSLISKPVSFILIERRRRHGSK